MKTAFNPHHAAEHGYSKKDWDDADHPEWTEEDFKKALPAENIPELAHLARRGRPKLKNEARKARLSMVADPDVLAYFRATGKGWQTRINTILKEWIETH
jgi:uncharacterized protein (DUF4415 family)